ncbi:uncharacterized protein LOC131249958 isoform X2 [Magnolia sinica]|nr:uncharacterized protein LOC131249958 isoform X2 [Magnolia sinica]
MDYHSSAGAGAVILDDCTFHESIHLDSIDMDRTLTLVSLFYEDGKPIEEMNKGFSLNKMFGFATQGQHPFSFLVAWMFGGAFPL